jgi:hypothetical protein
VFQFIVVVRTMVFWTTEQHIPEQKPPEDPHDFDDILAARTPTSWDQDEDVFVNDNDVSPDSSVGEPDENKEDIEIYVEERKKPETCSFSFFPWSFNTPDDKVDETRQVQETTTNASDMAMSPRDTQNTEAAEVPLDESIPPSDRVKVPFDECPLTVESAQSSGRSLTVEKVSEVESDSPFGQPIQKENSPLVTVSGNNKSSESEDGHPGKENEVSATVLTQRLQVGLSNPTFRDVSSTDALVNNLEAVARRIDALSDEIEEYRAMDSTSVKLQKSTSWDCSESLIVGKLSIDGDFKGIDTKVADEIEQCRSGEVVDPLGPELSDAIEDFIEACRTMDSTGSNVKKTSSVEYTESLIRKLSTDNDCMDTPDDEVEEDSSGAGLSGISIMKGRIYHPPSSSHKKTLITKDIDSLDERPLFDEIQKSSISTATSLPKTFDVPTVSIERPTEITHKLETIDQEPPRRAILKKEVVTPTSSRDEMSLTSSLKKVSFAQELFETCPSSTSDLDFDYMKHAFEGENGKNRCDEASVDEESIEESFFEESEYADRNRSPWFSLLLQAK